MRGYSNGSIFQTHGAWIVQWCNYFNLWAYTTCSQSSGCTFNMYVGLKNLDGSLSLAWTCTRYAKNRRKKKVFRVSMGTRSSNLGIKKKQHAFHWWKSWEAMVINPKFDILTTRTSTWNGLRDKKQSSILNFSLCPMVHRHQQIDDGSRYNYLLNSEGQRNYWNMYSCVKMDK